MKDPVQSWAYNMVQHPQTLILDTETTGLGPRAEVIEIAIVDIAGKILMDTLVQCQDPIPQDAVRIHGITKDMLEVEKAPTFPQLWPELEPLLRDHKLVIYNADYDLSVIRGTARRYKIALPPMMAPSCLMLHYSAHVGDERWDGDYVYQKLITACREFKIEHTSHRALGDAEAARQVLLKLAEKE